MGYYRMVYDAARGAYVRQDLTPNELNDVVIGSSPGTTGMERFIAKNLTANPAQMRAYLESIGYETKPYGTGYNFVVRRSGGEPWKPVDPRGITGVGEAVMDLLDFTGDAVVGTIANIGRTIGAGVGGVIGSAAPGAGTAAGAIAGGVAGGAVGGALGELAREGLGSLAHVPDNFSPVDTGVTAALEGILPGAAAFAGATIRAAGRGTLRSSRFLGQALLETGESLAGIRRLSNLPAGETLRRGVNVPEHGRSVGQIAKIFTRVIHTIGERDFPESVKAGKMIKEATDAGHTLELTNALEPVFEQGRIARLMEAAAGTGKPSGVASVLATGPTKDVKGRIVSHSGISALGKAIASESPTIPKAVIDRFQHMIDTKIGSQNWKKVKLTSAVELKRELQRAAVAAGEAFERFEGAKGISRVFENAAGQVQSVIEAKMHALGYNSVILGAGEGYSALMRNVSRKMRILNHHRAILKSPDIWGSTKKAENYIQQIYRGGNSALFQSLYDLEDTFGVKLRHLMEAAILRSRLYPGGKAAVKPKLAVTGQFVGTALLGGPAFAIGGPGAGAMGAAAGFLGGLALTSPRSIFGMTRFGVNRLAPAVDKAAASAAAYDAFAGHRVWEALARTAAASATAALGKAVAPEDNRRRRLTVMKTE